MVAASLFQRMSGRGLFQDCTVCTHVEVDEQLSDSIGSSQRSLISMRPPTKPLVPCEGPEVEEAGLTANLVRGGHMPCLGPILGLQLTAALQGQRGLGCLAARLEDLTELLFKLHDLNGNGVLEEQELIRLNEQLAVMHHGKEADVRQVRMKYRELFRSKLNADGKPVPYRTFRAYAHEVLDAIDTDPQAQEMILEQFIAEALSGREALHLPVGLAAIDRTLSGRSTEVDTEALSSIFGWTDRFDDAYFNV